MKYYLFIVTFALSISSLAHAENPYQLKAEINEAGAKVKPGDNSFSLTIIPAKPWVLKMKTPLKISLKSTPGLNFSKEVLGKEDVVEPKNEVKQLKTKFNVSQAGEYTISANASFFLCTSEICKRFTDATETKFKTDDK